MFSGLVEFTSVRVPILAIFADHADKAFGKEYVEAQIAATQRAAPGAHIVRLAHADHYVFRSNEGEVLKATREFIETLPATVIWFRSAAERTAALRHSIWVCHRLKVAESCLSGCPSSLLNARMRGTARLSW